MKTAKSQSPLTVAEIAALCKGEVKGNEHIKIEGFAHLETAEPFQACYVTSPKTLQNLKNSQAGLCILSPDIEATYAGRFPQDMSRLLVGNPRLAFAQAMQALFPKTVISPSISDKATISSDAEIGAGSCIEEGVFIGPKVRIGKRCHIRRSAVLDENVTLGDDCEIRPGAVLRDCELGSHVRVGIGTCIGSDGFGFVPTAEGFFDIPHVGGIVIGNHVSFGSHNVVQTGTFEPTRIGNCVRLGDCNLISHNCNIGDNSILAGMIGLAGSVTLGTGVQMGPRASANIGVIIGDGAKIGPSSAVQKDVPPNIEMFGTPAQPARDAYRQLAALKRLAKPSNTGQDSKR